jgi:hypothetical protein
LARLETMQDDSLVISARFLLFATALPLRDLPRRPLTKRRPSLALSGLFLAALTMLAGIGSLEDCAIVPSAPGQLPFTYGDALCPAFAGFLSNVVRWLKRATLRAREAGALAARSALCSVLRSSASLARYDAPSMRTTSARCIKRSIDETTQAALGKTSPHSANARLVVTTVLLCW